MQLSYEPYLRLFDARLYEIIQLNGELKDIAPQILMGTLLSHAQYNVYTIPNALRFLDATVHGDFQFQILVSCAAFSLAVRYRCPALFPGDDYQLKIISDQHQMQQDDIMLVVMQAMENGEKII